MRRLYTFDRDHLPSFLMLLICDLLCILLVLSGQHLVVLIHHLYLLLRLATANTIATAVAILLVIGNALSQCAIRLILLISCGEKCLMSLDWGMSVTLFTIIIFLDLRLHRFNRV